VSRFRLEEHDGDRRQIRRQDQLPCQFDETDEAGVLELLVGSCWSGPCPFPPMSKAECHHRKVSDALSDEEVSKMVSRRLPRWKATCDNAEADTVIFDHRVFGYTLNETFLLACAIWFALIAKKTVMIHP